jgi:uncharacterized membrane protein
MQPQARQAAEQIQYLAICLPTVVVAVETTVLLVLVAARVAAVVVIRMLQAVHLLQAKDTLAAMVQMDNLMRLTALPVVAAQVA